MFRLAVSSQGKTKRVLRVKQNRQQCLAAPSAGLVSEVSAGKAGK